jgi:hypothetical protein
MTPTADEKQRQDSGKSAGKSGGGDAGRGSIVFTRFNDSDTSRSKQKSMVEEHRRKLQVAKEEIALSKLRVLLPELRESLLRETLARSDWAVEKALVLLEGFMTVHRSSIDALNVKIKERKRTLLEHAGVDLRVLRDERKRKHRSESSKRRHRGHRGDRRRKSEDDHVSNVYGDEERKVFDDEAERERERVELRELQKSARLAEAYSALQGGKAAEIREQEMLKQRLQLAYRTGNTEEVDRLKERIRPD